MKKSFILIALSFLAAACFCETKFPQTREGNTHILSNTDLKKLQSEPVNKYTTDSLYKEYDALRKSCGKDSELFEKKCSQEFADRAIKISGYIKKVKKNVLGEYIVDLGTTKLLAWDIGVVYPRKTADDVIAKILSLKEGDYFEAVVYTRETYMYVDMPVWNDNGSYRPFK